RRHTRFSRDWSSDVCSSDLEWRLASAHEEQRQYRGSNDDDQVAGVIHPEDRMTIEQQVAQRAAADGGHHRDHDHAEDVQSLATRGERSADREDRHTDQVQGLENTHNSLLPSGTSWSGTHSAISPRSL